MNIDPSRTTGSTRGWTFFAVTVVLVLAASVSLAILQSLEALEERRAQSEAGEFRLAAHTLEADVMTSTPAHHLGHDLDWAQDTLARDPSVAIHALDEPDRRETRELLERLTDDHHGLGFEQLDRLVDLFAEAAESSGEAADAAERSAIQMLGVAAIAAAIAGALLLNGRRRERLLHASLRRQAETDELTELPNRRHLERALRDASERMRLDGGSTGLLYLDLDGFKGVNDSRGHDAGDSLLTLVADRLRRACGANETLVRIGGDEFAVVLVGITDEAEARTAAHRYLEILDRPCELSPHQFETMRASIGVAVTSDPSSLDELRREADLAMYSAKVRGGHGIALFDPSMREAAELQSDLTRALRAARIDEEFHLVYQPVVNIHDDSVLFAEALLRWTSPELGAVPPMDFIPIAEQCGEIHKLGAWVAHNVIDQLAVWSTDSELTEICISCNVSVLQLADTEFVDSVIQHLRRSGVDPARLTIEVTESAILERSEAAVEQLVRLRDAGVKIAIDDFGSGYSNLGQLLRAPFDVLKIDRALLLELSAMRQAMGGDPAMPCDIMSAITSIARTVGTDVVCEGVETQIQRTSLAASGVTHVQGWLIGKPTSPAEFIRVFGRKVIAA